MRTTVIIIVAILVALGGQLVAMPAHAAPRGVAVLFVHGWFGTPRSFDPMARLLAEHGIPSRAITLPGNENRANARAIATEAAVLHRAQPGRDIALVAHSMGGLSARYYLKYLGGHRIANQFIGMGTSQQGYWPACILPADQGGQMCPLNEFIHVLNAGVDLPADVTYTALASTEDSNDGGIAGRWCKVPRVRGVSHAEEPGDAQFGRLVLQTLTTGCPGRVVTTR